MFLCDQQNEGKFCLIHDVWTTKGNRYAFVGATANYINSNWEYKSTHLTLKMVGWRHFGALLARPIGRFLIRHGLHKKIRNFYFHYTKSDNVAYLVFYLTHMLAQTTDSGGNNGPMASELEFMFSSADDPVVWEGSTHHIRCYAHKLNLVVGHGLKVLGQTVGPTKPCTPHGIPLPIPSLEVNGNEHVDQDDSDSDDEDDHGLPDEPDGVDDDEFLEHDGSGLDIDEADVVAMALKKVNSGLIVVF